MIKTRFVQWLETRWYEDSVIFWLIPLGFIYQRIIQIRQLLYQHNFLKTEALPVPVIVVGNITVGGTGKTPLIIWMAQYLQQRGFNPGVISRGYGGKAKTWPQVVTANSDCKMVGDEPIVIARQVSCPIAVGPSRVEDAQLLITDFKCDIILSDDGLQHYRLGRTIEIAVIDGERGLGNGACLPAGPLREPRCRLDQVDAVIVNGLASHDTHNMQMVGGDAINLLTGEKKPLKEFSGIHFHLVAGIGHPQRFFNTLAEYGVQGEQHVFPDHHYFQLEDINFSDQKPVLMTEKDAVKCNAFAHESMWYMPIVAKPSTSFVSLFQQLISKKNHNS